VITGRYRQLAKLPCYGPDVSLLLPQQFPVICAADLARFLAEMPGITRFLSTSTSSFPRFLQFFPVFSWKGPETGWDWTASTTNHILRTNQFPGGSELPWLTFLRNPRLRAHLWSSDGPDTGLYLSALEGASREWRLPMTGDRFALRGDRLLRTSARAAGADLTKAVADPLAE
jgi:hypothetical protein